MLHHEIMTDLYAKNCNFRGEFRHVLKFSHSKTMKSALLSIYMQFIQFVEKLRRGPSILPSVLHIEQRAYVGNPSNSFSLEKIFERKMS